MVPTPPPPGLNNLVVSKGTLSYSSTSVNGISMYWNNAAGAGNLWFSIPTFTNSIMTGSWSFLAWSNLARVNSGTDNVWLGFGNGATDQGLQLDER